MLWLVLAVGGGVLGEGGALTVSSPLPPTNGHSLSGASSGLVVRTAQGLARGLTSRGSRQWLGLPYAAPPVGHLRY
jgi:para-nitrobenzyl esterase